MAQWFKDPTQWLRGCRLHPLPRSAGQGSGIATHGSIGHGRSSDTMLPWLWHRPQLQLQVDPYILRAQPEKKKRKKISMYNPIILLYFFFAHKTRQPGMSEGGGIGSKVRPTWTSWTLAPLRAVWLQPSYSTPRILFACWVIPQICTARLSWSVQVIKTKGTHTTMPACMALTF